MKFLLFLVSIVPLFSSEPEEFDLLMGKKTSYFEYLEEDGEKQAYDRYRSLYARHCALLSRADGKNKIPKVVHLIWLGPRQFPRASVEHVRSWIALNPGWKFKFWTDRARPAPCSNMETVVFKEFPFSRLGKEYAASDNWGEKSDLLRFEILLAEGGVYIDHDANCLHSFEALHDGFDLYCGLEAPHPSFAGHNLTAGIGVIGSRPGHPVIEKTIDLIRSRWDALGEKYPGSDGFSRTQIVIERTYLALTDALTEKVDLEGNVDIVLPAAYFFAKPGIPSLYSKHFFANSWADEDGKDISFEKRAQHALAKIDKRFEKILFFLGGFTILNLFLIGFTLLSLKNPRSYD